MRSGRRARTGAGEALGPRAAASRAGWALVLAVVLGACGHAPGPVAGASPRIVSLSPAITETIGALGATEVLVGRSDWCVEPPVVTALPALGSALTPALERIAGVRPTAIVVDGSVGTRTEALSVLAPVHVLPWLTAGEVAASTRALGALVGRGPEADALAGRLDALAAAPPGDQPALLVLGGAPLDGGELWYVKRNSLHGAALHAAGGRNAVDRDVPGPPSMSLEALVALNPRTLIVLSATPLAPEAAAADWARFPTVAAVREGRVGVVAGPAAMATGPRVLELVDLLRAELARLEGR